MFIKSYVSFVLIFFSVSPLLALEESHFFNALFKIQFQDTYVLSGDSFKGDSQTYSGSFNLIGHNKIDGERVAVNSSDEFTSESKRGLDLKFEILENEEIRLTHLKKDLVKVVKAKINYGGKNSIIDFSISKSDIGPFLNTSFLKVVGDAFSKDYGFDKDNNRVIEIPSNYRCYFRRKVVRCFVDVDYLYGTF